MFGSNAIVWADIAGRVSFVEGQASVINNSTKRSVFKGDIIHTGEQIETLKETTVQIRMIDDSVVALHPESLFEITQYNFNKNQPQSICHLDPNKRSIAYNQWGYWTDTR